MHPRPFYRSRLFWLGLPGLVFLLWGWWTSMTHYSGVSYHGRRSVGLGQLDGEILVMDAPGSPAWNDLERTHLTVPRLQMDEFKAMIHKHPPAGLRKTSIPHAWIVWIYVAGWLLALTLWQRRKSRLLKLHNAP